MLMDIFNNLNDILGNSQLALMIDYLNDIYYHISEFLSVQRLLPPLIMLVAVYLTLLSLYRTTTFFIRTILFFVKWGGLIAVIAVAMGYFSKDSYASKPRRHRTSRPRIWDTFAEHQTWRNEEHRPKEATDMIYETAGQIVDVARQFVHQGWQQTLSRFAIQTLTADEQENRQKTKSAKGNSKSR